MKKEKEKSIVEKLGITPGPWKTHEIEGSLAVVDGQDSSLLSVIYEDDTPFAVIYDDDDANLIASAPEMLEALIETVRLIDKHREEGRIPVQLFHSVYITAIESIEKATGKSWEEIKELL